MSLSAVSGSSLGVLCIIDLSDSCLPFLERRPGLRSLKSGHTLVLADGTKKDINVSDRSPVVLGALDLSDISIPSRSVRGLKSVRSRHQPVHVSTKRKGQLLLEVVWL